MTTTPTSPDVRPPAAAVLEMTPAGPGAFRASSVPDDARSVVFGGQLLGQMIVAAARASVEMTVRSVQAVFTRAGDVNAVLDVEVDTLHAGRTVAGHEVSFSQSGRRLCRGLVLCDRPDTSVIDVAPPGPDVAAPKDCRPYEGFAVAGSEVRLVPALDDKLPQLSVWVRWPGVGDSDQSVHQALLAWWTDPFLIPAAVRAAPELDMGMAHHSLSTGVLAHSLTFHREVDASAWHLVTNRVSAAGAGRVYGDGQVFTAGGRHVASFAQWSMVRGMSPGADRRSAM